MASQGPLSGQKIGEQYLISDLLGEGGFGAVYKGEHLRLRRPQAIKVLLERHFSNPEFRERFLREAQLLATLDHPHIVHVDDFWVEQDRAYLMMPFIGGGTLQDILQRQRDQHTFLALEQTISYLEQICEALDYAHQRGVVHLDLKPLNLLVHEDGRLLLSDFGLAHIMKQGVVQGGSSLRFGTPHYMAPEHFNGRPEKKSDLYSLGIIAYQMFASRLPYEDAMPEAIIIQHLMNQLPSIQTFRSELSQELETVLETALAKKPEQRYATATGFLTHLKGAIAKPQAPANSWGVQPAQQAEPWQQIQQPPAWVQPVQPASPWSQLAQPPPDWLRRISPAQPVQQPNPWQPVQPPPPWAQPAQIKVGYVRVEEGEEPGRIYEIRKESLSIGRSSESDIYFKDLALSRLHASLLNQGNGNYALKEEGSANGTTVNEVRVQRYQTVSLYEGDRIKLGYAVLVFGYRQADPWQPIQQAPDRDQPPQTKVGYLYIEEGREPGRIYDINKEVLTIGRSRERDIFLIDLAVSILHASIINQGNGNYALRDDGSANGTKVNGVLLGKYQMKPLQMGDRIEIGQTVLGFDYYTS